MIQKFTKEQALVVTGYTGFLAIDFAEFHSDVEKRLGYPVFTHMFGDKDFVHDVVRAAYLEDFRAMAYE